MPAELIAGVTSQKLEERSLRTAVALAERIQCVQVGQQPTRRSNEPWWVNVAQQIGLRHLAEDPRRGWAQMPGESEHAGALGDVDGAKLACPVVDAREEAAMDGLQGGEVAAIDGHP